MISARDPGAAHHLCEIAHHVIGSGQFVVDIAASPPASEIFRNSGLEVRHFFNPRASFDIPLGKAAALAAAKQFLDDVRPDALLVGLSGPDCGIDEALIAQAGPIPTYAYQDFWGDVNPGFGLTPATYFVLDEEAAALTTLQVRANIAVAGSARHCRVFREHAEMRRRSRTAWGVPNNTEVLVFFGQPLAHIDGYLKTIAETASAFCKQFGSAAVFYRPHPKESFDSCKRVMVMLTDLGMPAAVDESIRIEDSLCGGDLNCTCFSSCGLDFAYLNRSSSTPLASMLYLLHEDDIRNCFRQMSKLDDIPLSASGITTTVHSPATLQCSLENAMTSAFRAERWLAAKRKLMCPENAAQTVARIIQQDLAR